MAVCGKPDYSSDSFVSQNISERSIYIYEPAVSQAMCADCTRINVLRAYSAVHR